MIPHIPLTIYFLMYRLEAPVVCWMFIIRIRPFRVLCFRNHNILVNVIKINFLCEIWGSDSSDYEDYTVFLYAPSLEHFSQKVKGHTHARTHTHTLRIRISEVSHAHQIYCDRYCYDSLSRLKTNGLINFIVWTTEGKVKGVLNSRPSRLWTIA